MEGLCGVFRKAETQTIWKEDQRKVCNYLTPAIEIEGRLEGSALEPVTIDDTRTCIIYAVTY